MAVPTTYLNAIYGADFGARVQWVQAPEPAPGATVAAPDLRQAGSATTDAGKTSVLTATAAAHPVLVAASAGTADAANGAGDLGATPLKPSSQWQVSAQSGDFDWSQKLRVPPAAAGPAPALAIGYSSSAIDGETGSTNNQPAGIGNGWDLAGGGSITRTFVTCAFDTPTGVQQSASSPANTGDQCYRNDNATLNLNGQSATLVKGTDGVWRLSSDDGSTVTYIAGQTTNGTQDNGFWRVTARDGTQYNFGLNRLPGWTTPTQSTNSVFTEPVYSNDSGEPCYKATFNAASCAMAWQWNLDYVVDVHHQTEAFYYTQESDNYTANSLYITGGNPGSNPTTLRSYVRGGYLSRIDYGMHAGTELTASAPDQVRIDHAPRCLTGSCGTHDTTDWPDTPWDQDCITSTQSCPTKTSPSFFTENRIADIRTQYLSAAPSTYTGVDTWTLHQGFTGSPTASTEALWLTGISHTGTVGGTATVPDVTFGGNSYPNRILTNATAGLTTLDETRLTTIRSESGATTVVNYLAPDCTGTTVPTPQTNTTRCYPQWWTPPTSNGVTYQPEMDWFAKYPVASVGTNPVTGAAGSAQEHDTYTYNGPGWRYDNSPLVPDGKRTWSQFAGFSVVRVDHGDPASPATEQSTTTHYFQGMNGDRLNASGGTKAIRVTASDNTQVLDELWWAGDVFETNTTNGTPGNATNGGPLVSKTITVPYGVQTGTDGQHVSEYTGDASSTTSTYLAVGGPRVGVTQTGHDSGTCQPV